MSSLSGKRESLRAGRIASVASASLLSALFMACSGTTGPAGAAGATGATGPTGPTSTGSALNVSTATTITGTITSVAISGPPVVKFELTDQNNAPLQGLPAADVGFAIAQLVPGQNGSASQWNSYIYGTVAPSPCPAAVVACATTPKTQAMVEAATSGTFVDHGDGTYQYTFQKDITKDPLVTYSATLTHRVGFEIRNLAQANNGCLYLPALDRCHHRYLQPRDRRDGDLRSLPHLPDGARRCPRRGAVLRDVPQPWHD